MAKVKTTNYTPEMIDVLKAGYTGSDNASEIASLATATGKTPASVRAKLASLGLYKAAERTGSDDSERITKQVIAEAIGQRVGLMEHETEGLAKATKSALDKVLAALA
jgi:hypothetical protein